MSDEIRLGAKDGRTIVIQRDDNFLFFTIINKEGETETKIVVDKNNPDNKDINDLFVETLIERTQHGEI